MAVTFDGENLVITLETGVTIVDVEQALYSDWKEWFKTGTNSRYPLAFRTVGGDNLTPGIDAGAYFFLRNDLGWRIRPAEEDATVLIVGNLAPEDSSLPMTIPTIGAFTVLLQGLQPITQSVDTILTQTQEALYDGRVTIDTVNGEAGTAFPIGTASRPVDNVSDAATIASSGGRDIREFAIRGSLTLNQNFTNWTFSGIGSIQSDTISLAGFDVDGSIFENLTLTGTITGAGQLNARNCVLNAVSGLCGQFNSCTFIGAIDLIGTSTFMIDCAAGGFSGATLDANGAGNVVTSSNLRGAWVITNATSGVPFPTTVALGLLDAKVTFAAGNTGTLEAGGLGRVIDNVGTVDIAGLIDPADVALTRKILQNRQYTNAVTGNMEQYDDADTAIEYEAPIYSDDGVTPYDGTQPIVRRDRYETP